MNESQGQAVAMPPEHLRMRVSLVSDPADFDTLGRHAVVDLKRALAGVGRPLNGFRKLLDWGCGPGGTVRHLLGHFPGEIHACDIDREAVAWIQANLPFVQATPSDEWPPLPYADGAFDLVINHSVLTHLDEAHQDAWLAELRRVLSPQGVLVLTVHGTFSQEFWVENLPRDQPDRDERVATMYRAVDEHGIYFMRDDAWAADFPLITRTRSTRHGTCSSIGRGGWRSPPIFPAARSASRTWWSCGTSGQRCPSVVSRRWRSA